MLARKALWRPRESVALKLVKSPADGRLLEEFFELKMMIEQPVTNGGELIFFRHVGAGGNDHFAGAHVKVVARARGLF